MTNTTTKAADFSVLFGTAYQRRTHGGTRGTGDECACCGRDTAREFFVEFEAQGFFPVGPECFKKLSKAGITVKTAAELDAE